MHKPSNSGKFIITILVRDFHETFFIHYYSVDSVHALKSRGEPSSLRWIAQDHVKTLQFLWEDQHSTPQDGSRFQARDQMTVWWCLRHLPLRRQPPELRGCAVFGERCNAIRGDRRSGWSNSSEAGRKKTVHHQGEDCQWDESLFGGEDVAISTVEKQDYLSWFEVGKYTLSSLF